MKPDRWLRLELRHLAALRAVSEQGSFAAAAEALGYTASAISQQIAMLEEIVGAQLVMRPQGRRRAVLTEVGRTLLVHADVILSRLNAARADVEARSAGRIGALCLGTYQSVAARVLPAVLSYLRRDAPRIEVDLYQSPEDAELHERVLDGRLDAAFATLPTRCGALEGVELLSDPYVLLVPAASPWAERSGPVSLREMDGSSLIGLSGCSQQPLIDNHLRALGLEPTVSLRSQDNTVVQSLVAAGFGVALVPRLTVDPLVEATAIVEIEPSLPPRSLGLLWHSDRAPSTAISCLIEAADRAFAAL